MRLGGAMKVADASGTKTPKAPSIGPLSPAIVQVPETLVPAFVIVWVQSSMPADGDAAESICWMSVNPEGGVHEVCAAPDPSRRAQMPTASEPAFAVPDVPGPTASEVTL